MPLFYFDIKEDEQLAPDEVGTEFESEERARREAAKAAADIGRDIFSSGRARRLVVEVRNDRKQPVLVVTITMCVQPIQTEQ